VLPEVVYAYGLKDAIEHKFLKEPELNAYKNVHSEEFIHQIITHFWKHHQGKRYEGLLPKLAIFASQIEELQSEVKPGVEKVLDQLNIPLNKILVNVGDLKCTTNDEIREFNKLDTPESDKQFILLVNKGREGWNCHSLFGCALYRKPKSKIFVLQATMRCLRSIGDVQETGRIYLSEENYQILDDELQQNFRVTVEEINMIKTDKIKVEVRVKKPPVKFKLKRIKHSYDLKEKNSNSKIRFDFSTVDFERYKSTVTTQLGMTPEAKKETTDITDSIQKYSYSSYMLIAEISRYLNKPCLVIEQILEQSYEGMDQVLKFVNKYNQLLYDLIIPKLFHYFWDIEDKIITEEEEVELAKPPEGGFYNWRVRKDLLVVDNEESVRQFVQKSFHLDHYCFDSSPEKQFFLDFLMRNSTSQIYFTGMLSHGESDFFISYIDPISQTVRKYYPDFLMQNQDGTWTMIEIKGDYMIDDTVTAAKEKYALEMGFVNKMEYRLMEASLAGNGQILM
jgi:hypothetical protein